MGKKKIIINRSQLKKINEVDLSVTAADNTSAGYGAAINNTNTRGDLQKLKNSGSDPGAIISGPNTTDQSPSVDVNVPVGQTPTVALNDPTVSSAIKNGASARIHGDGFPMELKRYTKKQVEESRIRNIKKNGITTTKKNLFESLGDEMLDFEEKQELAEYCKTADFFIFGYSSLWGWKQTLINTREDWREEVISDIFGAGSLVYTHEKDREIGYALGNKVNLQMTDVVKVNDAPSGDKYYIIWERDDA